MVVLELTGVSKWHERRRRRILAIDDVSMTIDAGEFVGVYGARGSGRTTLLRLAAGVEPADRGTVRAWCPITRQCAASPDAPTVVLAERDVQGMPGRTLAEHVALPLLATKTSFAEARSRAVELLRAAGVPEDPAVELTDLEPEHALRVELARAMASGPRVLLADEPTLGMDGDARDRILLLLRAIAKSGVAVLITTDQVAGIAGVRRALTLDEGELHRRARPRNAPVIELRRTAR